MNKADFVLFILSYPIVTQLDVCDPSVYYFIYDYDKLMVDGSWGLFHEFGHNMQRSEWTFSGTGEVTNNIFGLYANWVMLGKDVLNVSWLKKNINTNSVSEYFKQKPTYETFNSDTGLALSMFAQLIKYFGWEPMKKFMKDYEYDISYNRSALPYTNEDKIDQWVIRYSKILSRNIKPHFEMFGLPVSSSVDKYVSQYPDFYTNEKTAEAYFTPIAN